MHVENVRFGSAVLDDPVLHRSLPDSYIRLFKNSCRNTAGTLPSTVMKYFAVFPGGSEILAVFEK